MRGPPVWGTVARVDVERALERLGGIASAGELHRACGRGRVRVALRHGRVLRDARGRYALPETDDALRAAHRLSGVLWLDSAALHHGWKVKQRPGAPAVTVRRNRKLTADQRAGVRIRYLDLGEADVRGAATGHVRTVMDGASRLRFDEALTIADSALRAGDVTKAQLREAAARMPDRYRARCVRVAGEADGRADNPFESVLRAIALDVSGLAVRPQVQIGRRRVDLADERLRLVLEADSFEFHGERAALRRDCERYNILVLGGWTVLRFSWEHVMFHPEYVRSALVAATRQPSRRALGPVVEPPAA